MPEKKAISMEQKDIEFKFTLGEGETEAGTFTGYLSVFEVVDSYGDVVKRGAFKKTLREKKQFPLLWSHDWMEPIGVATGVEDDKGLLITGKLNLDVQRAREIRSLMAQGAVTGLSIGYTVIKKEIDNETGIRTLKEINLWEGSPCVFQACPGAEVDDVKALRGGEPATATPAAEKPLDEGGLAVVGETLKSSLTYVRSLLQIERDS
jgi:HK97 family phage prohead protease